MLRVQTFQQAKSRGGYAKAEPLYQRALAIEEKTLGPNIRYAGVGAGRRANASHSLCKAADAVTKDLMLDYYKRYGDGRSAALHNARLTMINSQERSHPYFWAAFVPIGNWAPWATDR